MILLLLWDIVICYGYVDDDKNTDRDDEICNIYFVLLLLLLLLFLSWFCESFLLFDFYMLKLTDDLIILLVSWCNLLICDDM